ncbi:hypothetical protein [Paenibacillus sp. CMAA1364]
MAQRYKITRGFEENRTSEQTISLEESKQYFAFKIGFTYTNVYTVKGETTMSIDGEFFMWDYNGTSIPFRHYDGDIYVSGTNPAVIPMVIEVASELVADVVEE